MSLNDVSKLLWRERELLELLLFKLDEEHMIVAAGRTRWLVHAAREVEMVLDEVRRLELERAVVLDEVWAELALRQVPTLDGLARSTSGPWPQIFDGHRSALSEVGSRCVRRIADQTDTSRRPMLERLQVTDIRSQDVFHTSRLEQPDPLGKVSAE